MMSLFMYQSRNFMIICRKISFLTIVVSLHFWDSIIGLYWTNGYRIYVLHGYIGRAKFVLNLVC